MVKKVLAATIDQTNGIPTIKGFEGLFENAVGSILALGAFAFFILLIISGFKYITAGSDPKAAESAKKTLTYAIGGIIVLALSFLILQLIANITGTGTGTINLTNFRVFRN